MLKRRIMAIAVSAALVLSHPAYAAPEDDLKELRAQLRELKAQYETRIQALEKRLEQAEQAAATAATQAGNAQVAAQQAAAEASNRPTGENAFNPAVSLILNGTYANLSLDPNAYRISGFIPSNGDVKPPPRGASLGESELSIAANIDPNFRGTGIFTLTQNNTVAVEEAYVSTLAMSEGFTLRAGRMFSAVGYLNEIHPHAWDFTDAPLANKAFLGNQLADDGLQLRWIAPWTTYFDIGMDVGRGRNFPAGPDGGRNKNGFGAANVFAHLGGDLGASTAWQIGVSQLNTRAQDRTFADLDSTGASVIDSFSGDSRLWALSGVLKWAPAGNATSRNFKIQGEYFQRSEDGMFTYDTTRVSRGLRAGGLRTRQSGGYLQGVYQFMPEWRIGYRYDRLDSGSRDISLLNSGVLTAADLPAFAAYNPTRNTVMTDWSPSEFSRIRLQFAQDKSRQGLVDNQMFVQYIMSLGAHGAHKF